MSQRGIHVLMTADTLGGVWTYACELIGALKPFGVDVTLATMGSPMSPAQARMAAALDNLDVVESKFALEWMPDPWREVDAAGDWLMWLAGKCSPDIVHVNGFAHAALPFGVPVVSVVHSCACSWIRAVRGHEAGPEWNEYRRRVSAGLRASSVVIAPTKAIVRAVFEAHGLSLPARVIPNGRALARRSARKELFVLSAGRVWDEAKGLADLVACARRVPWPIRVAGPRVNPTTNAEVHAPHVEMLGELATDDVVAMMGRASIFASPARYEPFGLAVLEAALSECALVLSDLDTFRETWRDAAVYVHPGDSDALAFQLEQLIRDPLRRIAFSACARARALALTPLRMASSYRGVYDELIAYSREVCA
jgi:glycogen synthase